jgi:hypothetical protein
MRETPSTSSTRRRVREGLLLSLVSAAFVCLGIALRDRVPWYATAFFAVCLVAGLLLMLGVRVPDPAPTDRLTIDDVGITRTARTLREHVAWGDIARVRIMTTDEGPWLEDVFFVIDAKHGNGCVVAHDLAVRSGLLEALQSRLKGVDNAAVIEAMTTADNRVLTIWEEEGSA